MSDEKPTQVDPSEKEPVIVPLAVSLHDFYTHIVEMGTLWDEEMRALVAPEDFPEGELETDETEGSLRFEPHEKSGSPAGKDFLFGYWLGPDYMAMMLSRALLAAKGFGYEVLWDAAEEDHGDHGHPLGWVILTDMGDAEMHSLIDEEKVRQDEIAALNAMLKGEQ